jgi:arylsulfatase A-like enzyme
VVKYPKGRRPSALAARVDQLSQSIDVLPSLLALAGLGPDSALPGKASLTGSFQPFAVSEIKGGGWALIEADAKLIEEDGRARLYDLLNDPGETRDVAASQPERVASMRAAAKRLRETVGEGEEAPSIETELDAEALQSLRSLGYVR